MMRYPVARKAVETTEMVMAAMTGKGGGSGWDSSGQVAALVKAATLRKGMVVFDVGANNGAWAKKLSEVLGRECCAEFHLFEPAPYCFDSLERNAAEIPRATIVRRAVSNKQGTAVLHLPVTTGGSGSGLASLHRRNDTSVRSYRYKDLSVETITIDEYILHGGIEIIDILKIDVEGHEMSVLEGARRAFGNRKIRTVFFEFGSANVNSRTFFRDFWDFFTGMGYDIARVVPGGGAIPLVRYDDLCEYFRGASNYIASQKMSA